jgi:hypothetical protein
MMRLSKPMPVELPQVVFAGIAEMALPEMMTPTIIKMTPVGIMRIIPVGAIGSAVDP